MKKVLLSLALLAGAAGAANAQGLKLGLKGGFNGSTFSGSDSKGSEYKAGFAAGGILNYGFTDMISVQGELLYSQKGASQDIGSETAKITIGYIDVPVLFKVNTGDAGKGLFFEIGPVGSFLMHQRTFFEDSSGKQIGESETSTDGFNKVVLGYAAGLGYQLTSGLGLGVRYNGDLSQIYEDANGAANIHNSVFQFQVHYMFGGSN